MQFNALLTLGLWICLTGLTNGKHRVVISTDFPPIPVTNSDPDDVQSMD
jgi:hypothetical protein